MYKEKSENVEIYFICYKKENMKLIETYYDEILDIHCWYFNCYLAYNYWKSKYKFLSRNKLNKILLTTAASRYIIYKIENKKYKNKYEYKKYLKELNKIQPELKKVIKELKI